jgi:hypothetical protein
MAQPQVEDGRKASSMEGSCEYIDKAVTDNRQGRSLQLGGSVRCYHLLTVKTGLVTKRIHKPQAWTYPFIGSKQWKRDMRMGTRNVRSLCR